VEARAHRLTAGGCEKITLDRLSPHAKISAKEAGFRWLGDLRADMAPWPIAGSLLKQPAAIEGGDAHPWNSAELALMGSSRPMASRFLPKALGWAPSQGT